VLALLGGSLELHRDAAGHLAFPAPAAATVAAGAGDDTVYACPAEHGAASHFERARPVERHDCAACLHRLQTRGGELSAFAVVAADACAGHARAGLTPGPAAPVLDRAPSRGPPAA
jgi:hypothetical protein